MAFVNDPYPHTSADAKDEDDVVSASADVVIVADTDQERAATNAVATTKRVQVQEEELRLCQDACTMRSSSEQTSLNTANTGAMQGDAEDEKERMETTSTTAGNTSTDFLTIYQHELGVPLSLALPARCTSHNLNRPDRTAPQRNSSLLQEAMFDDKDLLCRSLDSNVVNIMFDDSPLPVSSCEQDMRVDSHRTSSSRSTCTEHEQTANATMLHEVNNSMLLSRDALPISESTAFGRCTSNDRSISRSSISDILNHITLSRRGTSSTDNDFSGLFGPLPAVSRKSTHDSNVSDILHHLALSKRGTSSDTIDFSGLFPPVPLSRQSTSTGDLDWSEVLTHLTHLRRGTSTDSDFAAGTFSPLSLSRMSTIDENVSDVLNHWSLARRGTNSDTTIDSSGSICPPLSLSSQSTSDNDFSDVLNHLSHLRRGTSTDSHHMKCLLQDDPSGMKNGESVCHMDDARREKSTSEDKDSAKDTILALFQQLKEEDQRQPKGKKRKSTKHVAEPDLQMSQDESSAIQKTILAYVNAEKHNQQPPKSRKKPRIGSSREQIACYTSIKKATLPSNSNNKADTVKQVLQSDPCGSELIQQSWLQMNSSSSPSSHKRTTRGNDADMRRTAIKLGARKKMHPSTVDATAEATILALVEQECRKQKAIKISATLSATNGKKDASPKVYFNKRDVDVIFGRGTGPNLHNQLFREQVRDRHVAYVEGNEETKAKTVNELKEWVRNRGGRFLDKDSTGWFEVNESAVRTKLRQSLREYKSVQLRIKTRKENNTSENHGK